MLPWPYTIMCCMCTAPRRMTCCCIAYQPFPGCRVSRVLRTGQDMLEQRSMAKAVVELSRGRQIHCRLQQATAA